MHRPWLPAFTRLQSATVNRCLLIIHSQTSQSTTCSLEYSKEHVKPTFHKLVPNVHASLSSACSRNAYQTYSILFFSFLDDSHNIYAVWSVALVVPSVLPQIMRDHKQRIRHHLISLYMPSPAADMQSTTHHHTSLIKLRPVKTSARLHACSRQTHFWKPLNDSRMLQPNPATFCSVNLNTHPSSFT